MTMERKSQSGKIKRTKTSTETKTQKYTAELKLQESANNLNVFDHQKCILNWSIIPFNMVAVTKPFMRTN